MYLDKGLFRRANRALTHEAIRRALFNHGQQGALYLPEPQYLYQDSAGTTPVTADGDPVGLILDTRNGAVRGSEIVTNGGFDSDTAWAKGTNVTISGGTANAAASPNAAGVGQGTATSGEWYEVTFTITTISEGGFCARAGGANGPTQSSPGTYTCIIRATAASSFGVITQGLSTTGSVDNVSVKSLSGNHAIQSTADSRPIYRTDGNLHWLELDGTDDYMVISGSASLFKFMHDGTGGLFAGAAYFGASSNPGANYCLFATSAAAANIGCGLQWRDLSTDNEALRLYVSNGSANQIDIKVQNSLAPQTVAVLRASYKSQSGDDGLLYKNGASIGSAGESASPSTSNATNDVNLFQLPGGTLRVPGRFYGGLFAPLPGSAVVLSQVDRYFASRGGVSL